MKKKTHVIIPRNNLDVDVSGIAQFVKESNRLRLEHELKIQYVISAIHYANPDTTDDIWNIIDPVLIDIVTSFLNTDSFVSNACCFCY